MIAAVDAPSQVRRAIVLLWASVLLGILDSIVMFASPDLEGAEFANILAAFTVLVTVAYCVVVHLASRRRNWARHVLWIVFVASTLVLVAFPPEEPQPWWDTAFLIVCAVLDCIALYWLFTGAGAHWYRQVSAR